MDLSKRDDIPLTNSGEEAIFDERKSKKKKNSESDEIKTKFKKKFQKDENSEEESFEKEMKKSKKKLKKEEDSAYEKKNKKSKKSLKKDKDEVEDSEEESDEIKKKSKLRKKKDEDSDEESENKKKISKLRKKRNEDSDEESEDKKKKSKSKKKRDKDSDEESDEIKKKSKLRKLKCEDSEEESEEIKKKFKSKIKKKRNEDSHEESEDKKKKSKSKKKKYEDSEEESYEIKKKSKSEQKNDEDSEDESYEKEEKKFKLKIKKDEESEDESDEKEKKKSKSKNDIQKKKLSDINKNKQYKKNIYIFNKKRKVLITEKVINEKESFGNIVKELKNIQIDSLNETSKYNFNFGNFVKLCLDVSIEKKNLEYIKSQIEDTINQLNYSNLLSKESLYSFYQIKIVGKFYTDLLEIIGSVKVENKEYKINSDELLNINYLKQVLLKFRLLEGLTNKGKSYFDYYMNPILYMPEINQLILKLNSLVLKKNKLALKEFVSFIFYNHNFLNAIEVIFPYNKFNEESHGKDFEIAYYYIKMMIEFYKNQTNFVLIFDNEEIPFIFRENQYERLFPILKLNEKKNIFLSIGTLIKYYLPKKEKSTALTIITKEEDVNRTKTVHFIKLLTENSGKIGQENINNIIWTFNKDNFDLILEKKFLSSNLFLTNNSIVPKIWTLLFSFNNNSEILKYIIDNLLPFEKDIFYIIKNNFYDSLNEKYQIENNIKFTEQMNFFYNEESFLWRNLIGKQLEKGLKVEEYNNYKLKVEKELSNIEKLRDFYWPEENINDYKKILNEQLEKIETRLIFINAQKNLTNLRSKLLQKNFKKELEQYQWDIIDKINKLLKGNLDEMLRGTKIIEMNINDLISISEEELTFSLGNNLNWGTPVTIPEYINDSKTIKLYKNMLYYSICHDLIEKILHSKDNRERMRYGIIIEKMGLISILKYINILGDETLNIEKRKIIKRMLRAQLMFKFLRDSIDLAMVKNFFQNLDEKAFRNQISDPEYLFTYSISNYFPLTTKIIQPKFEPKDIIYLFFQYYGDNEYSAGPIFEYIDIPILCMNNLLNKVLDQIKKKNLDNMCSICTISAIIIYREFFEKNNKEINYKGDEFNYDKVLKFFKNERIKKEDKREAKILDIFIYLMNLSKYYDEIIKAAKENPEKAISFEDMKIFDKGKEKRIEIESLLLKKINPSFKFYIIKNLGLLNTLINSNLKNEDISTLFEPQEEGEKYIPFWVFLIRNMSATNCIYYYNQNITFLKVISFGIIKKINELIKEKKGNNLNNDWLNLIVNEIPTEIEMNNIRLFYHFFNNLFEKLDAAGYSKQNSLIIKCYLELLNYSFEERISEILEDDIKRSEKDILKLINSPIEYFKEIFKKENINDNDDLKNLEKNLVNIIEEIPGQISKIKEKVKVIEKNLNEEKEQNEIEKKIHNIKRIILEYNSIIEDLINNNNKTLNIQIHPNKISILENTQKEIKKYMDFIEENEETITYWKIPFNNKDISIRYDKNIQIFRGKNNYLYFKINEIDDEFKRKFSVLENYNKTGKNKTPKILKDYIYFDKSEKVVIKKYLNIKYEELNNKIKQDLKMDNIRVSFRGKTMEELSSLINEIKQFLSHMKDAIIELKNGNFKNLKLLDLNYFHRKIKDLIYYFHLDIYRHDDLVFDIFHIKEDLESKLFFIIYQYEHLYKISKNFPEGLDNFNIPSLPEKKLHFVNYENLNLESPLLLTSFPTISKKNGVLKCNYDKISFQKGPFCPEFYSKPIIVNIISLVDEDIKAEIISINDDVQDISIKNNEGSDESYSKDEKNNIGDNIVNQGLSKIDSKKENKKNNKKIEKKEEEEEDIINIDIDDNFPVVDRKDIDQIKYMRVKNYIPAKEPIQVKIYIPKCKQRDKKENQKISRKLKLITGNSECEIGIEMKILSIPIELLLSCENYKLEFKDGSYHLKTNQLFPTEKLIFKIQNYIIDENIQIKARIVSLEGNASKEPKINIEKHIVIVNIPEINNIESKRLNCKIECYISENYKIPIIIDSVIIPINYSFQIYDFLNHSFISDSINIIIPISYPKNYFIKCLPKNNKLEIELIFLINIPFKNKKIFALIETETNYNVTFEFSRKEIILEKEKTEFKCKVEINCDNLESNEIALFTCKIGDTTKRISILKKDFFLDLKDTNLKEINILKFENNSFEQTYKIVKIDWKINLEKNGIFVCPFGYWNYQIVKYKMDLDKNNIKYYKLEPNPPNNFIYFISENGEIDKKQNTFEKISGFFYKSYQFPLFGICKNEWYPLIPNYENENELFYTFEDYKSFLNIYMSEISDLSKFKKVIEKNFPYSFQIIIKKGINFFENNKEIMLKSLFQILSENKILDVLKRFEKMKSTNSFSFSYFAFLIFEKTEQTIKSIKQYFPKSIKSKINEEIEFILKYNIFHLKDLNQFNLMKYHLIKKLYQIFISKMEEIKKNEFSLNITEIDKSEIENKVLELQQNFYYYKSLKKIIKTDSMIEIDLDIEKSAEEKSLIGNKFLIINNLIKCVNINEKRIKLRYNSDINNQPTTMDIIDIDEIKQPEKYTINSIIEYIRSSIIKAKMLPSFIRYAVKNQNEEKMKKSINILSELFNLYKSFGNHSNSLISSIIEEFQESFEILFYKLKNAGVDFSKDQELKNLKNINNIQIQDFIYLPKKDRFVIKENNFESPCNENKI